ncbi:adenosyl cobinamide kinase/adenosyl cobinamide phosphate guanylyltransferase/NaMN:DMB phosphoribosyltransferase [Allocatelliglobosispora scoriae]|uniref:Adenosylcobinamide kinase n=1 Tax=Allocatelliglobosispora scoriae TaxID=643052 RepID=A0A841BQA7_9ACTN|nr:bifunctional adenosylcobinamide kinase/adenosylcobinamide-phosphate guanylyltransferase [Allocatelliglobosispora scoriae]MBB5869496.1 adenosyl cobinamide kinase/adenosyl cobinamide phosphate guanylyltransferase/NaMN:DMB phosphoribosyltransferase [Allocatelliglobosispora scoriae]
MSVDAWTSALVLGGIRSGKSEFAESLVAAALTDQEGSTVRYVATAEIGDDPAWAERISAHQRRRPVEWTTEEIIEPADLLRSLGNASAEEIVLVDDLGGWVARLLDLDAEAQEQQIEALGWSVGACKATLVLVSSEVGLGLVPTTEIGAAYADLLGATNRTVADAATQVALVVAGQPSWLKQSASRAPAPAGKAAAAKPAVVVPPQEVPEVITPVVADPTAALSAPTMTLPMVATGLVIQHGMDLPMPNEEAERDLTARLATLDLPGAGFGGLSGILAFAAKTQGTATPSQWRSVRVMLVHADFLGSAAAGVDAADSQHRADQARAGAGPIGVLAARLGASLQVVDAATAEPIDLGSATTPEAVEAALRHGWRLAEEAADAGVDLLVLGSCGAGTETTAAAIVSSITGAEIAGLLGRRVSADGRVDDTAWMLRCLAARDALHRIKSVGNNARDLLTELGGAGMAIAVGLMLGATARRTAMVLDGPLGVAAGLLARDLAGQARHWCLLPDHGGDPTTKLGADVLGLDPILDLKLDLGEGASALAAIPLMQSALALAESLWQGAPPAVAAPAETEPDAVDVAGLESAAEPMPGGPGFNAPSGAYPVTEA